MPGAVVIKVYDANLENIRITVEEEGKEGGYIYFIFAEVKDIDTDNKALKTGNDTFSKNNGEKPKNTSESTIN